MFLCDHASCKSKASCIAVNSHDFVLFEMVKMKIVWDSLHFTCGHFSTMKFQSWLLCKTKQFSCSPPWRTALIYEESVDHSLSGYKGSQKKRGCGCRRVSWVTSVGCGCPWWGDCCLRSVSSWPPTVWEPVKCDKSLLAIWWDALLGFLEPEEKQISDGGCGNPFWDKAGFPMLICIIFHRKWDWERKPLWNRH